MSERRAVDALAVGLMLLLCLTWGFQQVAVKAVASGMSPVLQMALRSGIAACLLSLLIVWRGGKVATVSTLVPGIFAGVLFALEFLFLAEGLRFTTASRVVVFLYTTPILVALGLHMTIPSERLSQIQWIGVGMAFVGIVMAFMWGEQEVSEANPNQLLGDMLALLAAVAWAATTVLIRNSSLSNTPPTQTLWYQLIVCCLMLMGYALITGQTYIQSSTIVWVNLAFQALFVSFASLLTWFWLLTKYPASQLGVFTFMTPLFGVALGALILSESLPRSFLVGAVLVMIGIVLVNGHTKVAKWMGIERPW